MNTYPYYRKKYFFYHNFSLNDVIQNRPNGHMQKVLRIILT